MLQGSSVTLVDAGPGSGSCGKLYLFGGRLVSTRRMVSDLYELDLASLRWTRISSAPATGDESSASRAPHPQQRYFHSSDLWAGRLIIFGGMGYAPGADTSAAEAPSSDSLCVLDEVIAFDLATQTWDLAFAAPAGSSSAPRPVPRYAHLSSTMTAGQLVIIGGQNMANQYVEEINVFDLNTRRWTASHAFARQCGSYRSLAVAGRWRVENEVEREADASSTPRTEQQDTGAGVLPPKSASKMRVELLPMSAEPAADDEPLPLYVYTNYNFTDVKRELELVRLRGQSELAVEDRSSDMTGVSLPPGLRFPTGAILGSHLLISGTYLANTSQTFSVWSLHLPTMQWSRLDVGALLSIGSWNRAVLWPSRNRLIIFGHRGRDLVSDYNHRQTNWDHVLVLELEAWGINQPPMRPASAEAMELGLEALSASTVGSFAHSLPREGVDQAPALGAKGDFEIVCSDGMRIGCNRALLTRRWPWFAEQLSKYRERAATATAAMPNGASGPAHPSSKDSPPDCRLTPRLLHLAEPSPVVLALLQFFYTRSICTALQRHPSVIASLLLFASLYALPELDRWARHAAHVALSRELGPPPSNAAWPQSALAPAERHRLAVVLYETAALCGHEALQIRALRTVMAISKWVQRGARQVTDSSAGPSTPTTFSASRDMAIASTRDIAMPLSAATSRWESRQDSVSSSQAPYSPHAVTPRPEATRRWSATSASRNATRAQPPVLAPPAAPDDRHSERSSGGGTEEEDEQDDTPAPMGMVASASRRTDRKPLSKAERMLGVSGAELSAAGIGAGRGGAASSGTLRRPPNVSSSSTTSSSLLSVRTVTSSGAALPMRKRFSLFGSRGASDSKLSSPHLAGTQDEDAEYEEEEGEGEYAASSTRSARSTSNASGRAPYADGPPTPTTPVTSPHSAATSQHSLVPPTAATTPRGSSGAAGEEGKRRGSNPASRTKRAAAAGRARAATDVGPHAASGMTESDVAALRGLW
jgi:hypothetical protein